MLVFLRTTQRCYCVTFKILKQPDIVSVSTRWSPVWPRQLFTCSLLPINPQPQTTIILNCNTSSICTSRKMAWTSCWSSVSIVPFNYYYFWPVSFRVLNPHVHISFQPCSVQVRERRVKKKKKGHFIPSFALWLSSCVHPIVPYSLTMM